MSKKQKQIAPLSIRISPELETRLTKCAARTKQAKNALARDAVEAAVAAIERNNYRLVVPIEFEVTHIPVGKTEASAHPGPRPAAPAGGRSSGSTVERLPPHGTNEGDLPEAPRITTDSPVYDVSKKRSTP